MFYSVKIFLILPIFIYWKGVEGCTSGIPFKKRYTSVKVHENQTTIEKIFIVNLDD